MNLKSLIFTNFFKLKHLEGETSTIGKNEAVPNGTTIVKKSIYGSITPVNHLRSIGKDLIFQNC